MAAKTRTSNWNALPEQSAWLNWVEISVVLLALGYVVAAAPLGGQAFQTAAIIFSSGLGLYAILKVSFVKGAGARWGLPFFRTARPVWSLGSMSEDYAGFVTVGGTFLVGIVPIILLKLAFPMELQVSSAAYLSWCVIQDLVFFAIVLTNVESIAGSTIAIAIAAVLFGASHYPFWPLMAATTMIGAVWGYIFVQTRSFAWVLLSHFVMGLCLLG